VNGIHRLGAMVVGLVISFLIFGCCGISSLLADVDHLVVPIQNCGFPASFLCYLAAPVGRPWHDYYVPISFIILLCCGSLVTGLLLGAIHSNRVRLEDSVD